METVRLLTHEVGLVACQAAPWRPVTADEQHRILVLVQRNCTAHAPAMKFVDGVRGELHEEAREAADLVVIVVLHEIFTGSPPASA